MCGIISQSSEARWTYQWVEQQWRLCCLCKSSVESPEHALLECTSSDELNSLHKEFLDRMYTEIPHLPQHPMVSSIDLFKRILRERTTIRLLAKFTHEVLELFQAEPVYHCLRMLYFNDTPAQNENK